MTEIINDGDCLTVKLKGDLDHHNVTLIRQEIDGALESSTPELLIFDFSDVGFMDSSGIGLILGRLRVMRSFNGRIRIKNVSDYTRKLIDLAGLGKLILEENERTKKHGNKK